MTATSSPPPPPTKNVFRLHGVNVLNRKNVDSISRLSALERRRTTHILDERQRRDTMNQLLGELANLVRESSPEEQQQPQQQARQKQFNPDGTEKRPPVKSNSITTLRNAISEIRRLRNCAGLETNTPPCAASLAVNSPNASRSSSPMDVSTPQPQSQQQKHLLPSLAPMVSQYAPMGARPIASSEAFANQTQSNIYPSHHQLQSPPLSPSSPKNLQYMVSPPMVPVHHQQYQAHSQPSLFVTNSSMGQVPQSQYYQQPQLKPYHHGQVPIQYRQTYDQQSAYKPHCGPAQTEQPQPFSRSSSPGPMMLPQPYIQHPTYQSSYAQV